MAINNFLRILLVEDDDDHAELVARGLAMHNRRSQLHRVSDGEEALNYLFHQGTYADHHLSPRPDLILLDLRLPKVGGSEVLGIIKGSPELQSIPVVILTTSAADRDVAAAYQQHVNSYLVKPIEFSQFSEMMAALGFYWLDLNYKQPDAPVGTSFMGTA